MKSPVFIRDTRRSIEMAYNKGFMNLDHVDLLNRLLSYYEDNDLELFSNYNTPRPIEDHSILNYKKLTRKGFNCRSTPCPTFMRNIDFYLK